MILPARGLRCNARAFHPHPFQNAEPVRDRLALFFLDRGDVGRRILTLLCIFHSGFRGGLRLSGASSEDSLAGWRSEMMSGAIVAAPSAPRTLHPWFETVFEKSSEFARIYLQGIGQ